MFKILNGLTPQYLSEIFTYSASFHDYGLRLCAPQKSHRFLQKQFCIQQNKNLE